MAISHDIGTQLPVSFSIEPSEEGNLLYLPVAPGAAGEPIKGMVYFNLRATNNTDKEIIAKELTVSFPGTTLNPIDFPSREVKIAPHASREVGLKPGDVDKGTFAEEIMLEQIPPKLKVSLVFVGLDELVWQTWDLAQHKVSYDFFARPESTTDFGLYITLPGRHYYGGGSQHFGFDANVLGRNDGTGELSAWKSETGTNEGLFIWGRPFYASGAGKVVRAVDSNEDNPAPGKRAFTRRDGEYQSTYKIGAVAVSELSKFRSIVAAVAQDGSLRLTAFEQDRHGNSLTVLAEGTGPQAERVSVAGLSSSLAVTATTPARTHARLILWTVSVGNKTCTQNDELIVSNLAAVKVVGISPTRIMTVGRTQEGNLSLSVWGIAAGKFVPKALGGNSGGKITSFDAAVLSATRVATTVRTESNGLKVIIWDLKAEGGIDTLGGTGVPVIRVGEAVGGGTISEVAVSKTSVPDQVATVVRTNDGSVKLIVWDVTPDGKVTRNPTDDDCGSGSMIDVAFWKTFSVGAAFSNDKGNLKIVAWEPNQEKGSTKINISQLHEYGGGATDLIAIGTLPTDQPTLITALRTAAGVLKVNLYQFSDSNLISILYGDEMMNYVHLKQGSIPDKLLLPGATVSKGEPIGEMGHSGKSGGPHLHIDVLKVRPDLVQDIPKLHAALEAGDAVGVFRPLQFHGVEVVRQDDAKPDYADNPWSNLDGKGTYFETYLVWPKIGP